MNYDEIVSIESIEIDSKRYDVTVENNHNFYANDILVHNCQNLTSKFNDYLDTEVQITIKLDGSSLTAYKITDLEKYYRRAEPEDNGIYVGVCSRNLELKDNDASTFWNVVKINNIHTKLRTSFSMPNIAIQGEFISTNIQSNYEKVNSPEFHVFSIFDIDTQKYIKPQLTETMCADAGIKHVPVIFTGKLRDFASSVEDLLLKAEGPGMNEGVKREGIVIKALDGSFSFKAISNSYLVHKDRK
jgi:RNA ligase (TIGR02306 family)